MSRSIRVNNFQWDPGKNDREYIKLLEEARDAWEAIAQKAISKLKQQAKAREPVKPILKHEGWNKYHNNYVCPICDQELVYEQNYCSECGRAVKWDA